MKETNKPAEHRSAGRLARRHFIGSAAAGMFAAAAHASGSLEEIPFGGSITDVGNIRVGHFTDSRRPTGCTVLLFENGAVAGVDVRGAAPGTRETDLLNPVNSVQSINGIVLSGGSAFGLDTASGVMRYLDERGIGFHVDKIVVPIVPAAILFDLNVGDSNIRPDATSGYKACQAAATDAPAEGNVGAGAGATVGKFFGGRFAMKSGIGSASIKLPSGLVVAALVAVNAAGDVIDFRNGQTLAGARRQDGSGFRNTIQQMVSDAWGQGTTAGHTTIGVVATNALLSKTEANKMAQMAHDGLARTINPVHTPADGDTIFAAATGTLQKAPGPAPDLASLILIGSLGAEVMARAVIRAVLSAKSISGYPAAIR